jgi:hypothetical protein
MGSSTKQKLRKFIQVLAWIVKSTCMPLTGLVARIKKFHEIGHWTTDKELKNKIKIGLRELNCGDCGDCGSGLCPLVDFVINGIKPSGSATRMSEVSATRGVLLTNTKSLDLSSTSSRYAFHSRTCRNC